MNWTLVVVAAIMMICAAIGCKKGLVKVLFSMLALTVILVVTSVVAPRLTPALKSSTNWYDTVRAATEDYLEENGALMDSVSLVDSDVLSGLMIPSSAKNTIAEKADEYMNQGVDSYNRFVVTTISDGLFSIMVYVGVLIVVTLLVLVLYLILHLLSKLPGLREANRVGGLLVGLTGGLVLTWIGLTICTIFFNKGLGTAVNADIQNNGFLTFLYDKNPFLFLIMKLV